MSSPINVLFNEWKIEIYFQPEMFLIGVSNLFQNWTDFVPTNLLCTCLDNQYHTGPVTQAKSLSRQVLLILGLRKWENHFSHLSPLCSPFSWLFLQLRSHPCLIHPLSHGCWKQLPDRFPHSWLGLSNHPPPSSSCDFSIIWDELCSFWAWTLTVIPSCLWEVSNLFCVADEPLCCLSPAFLSSLMPPRPSMHPLLQLPFRDLYSINRPCLSPVIFSWFRASEGLSPIPYRVNLREHCGSQPVAELKIDLVGCSQHLTNWMNSKWKSETHRVRVYIVLWSFWFSHISLDLDWKIYKCMSLFMP